jgi:G3E family GTPase
MREPGRTLVTVVTGEFGSGKSSVVRRLVDLAVAEGEAVAVLSASATPPPFPGAEPVVVADEEVVERSPGCVCCAVRSDVVRVLRNLAGRRRRPARVIVETSGIADVATVEQTLLADPALRRLVVLDGVVTTVDAGVWSVRATTGRPADPVVEEQVALADVVVVTRPDRLTDEALDGVRRRLHGRNRLGRTLLARPGERLSPLLLDVARADPVRLADRLDQLPPGRIGCRAGGIETLVLAAPGRLDRSRVEQWVEGVHHRHGRGLLRFHAVLALADGEQPAARVVYRGLRGHLVHDPDPRLPAPPACPPEQWALNRLAVMGRALDIEELHASLTDCVVA